MERARHHFSLSDYYNSREDYAQNWQTIDETLYRLCRDHPSHDDRPSVTAKVVIVGRTYATGIERKVSTKGTQGSSISQVADCVFTHREEIDQWFARLGKVAPPLTTSTIPEILVIHGQVVKLLAEITIGKQLARSFVSKYMHFHNPVVPIYDSVAAGFLSSFVPMRGIEIPTTEHADHAYAEYVYRFAKLHQSATSKGVPVTVRFLDNYLLWTREKSRGALSVPGRQAVGPSEQLRWDIYDLSKKLMAEPDASFQEFGKALKVLIIQNTDLQLRLDAFRALLLEPAASLEDFQKVLGIPIISHTDPALDEVQAAYEDASRALQWMHLDEISENLQIRTDYCTDYSTAVHESGQAVAAIVLGFGPLSRGATIVPEKPEDDDVTLDMTHSQVSHPSSKRWLRKRVVLAMAGGIAEQRIRENGWHNGRHRDVDQVQHRISQLAGNPEAFTALKQELLAEATELISRHWESIVRVADRLVRSKTLSGREVEAIVAESANLALAGSLELGN